MKAIVIYTSRYGSTETYARWLAEALNCPAKRLKDIKSGELSEYDTILYGGGLYAGSVSGFKKFLPQLNNAQDKTLVLFMVGNTNPAQTEIYAEIAGRNIPAQWKEHFQAFPLRGDQRFSKMSGLHKLMMRMVKAEAEKKPAAERTEDDKGFLENWGRDVIFSDRKQLEPILNYLQGKDPSSSAN